MIWAGIVDQTIVGLSKIDEGVKLNYANYCNFIDKNFFAWYKSQSRSFNGKCVFMHDNLPAHIAKLTCELFANKMFYWRKDNVMATIKSWSEINRKSMVYYEDGIIWKGKTIYKQSSQLEEIKTAILETEPAEVQKAKLQNEWIIDCWLFLKTKVTI